MRSSRFATLLVIFTLVWSSQSYDGISTFGFDVHHLSSDPVKALLAINGFPEHGSHYYYVSMARRDRIFRRRHLAQSMDLTPLTFLDGNDTLRVDSLGYLHYAKLSMGTPGLSFLVALDTGSDLLWLPCECSSCPYALKLQSGKDLKLNIYSPRASSTSLRIPCNSSLCTTHKPCSSSKCPYQVTYLSNGTSSSGTLVQDVLHLVSDDDQKRSVDAQVLFGCGQNQRGTFLQGAAPNGLFGLGMKNISVLSTLAKNGLVSNSFSMCFGKEGLGRISFGDEGGSDQSQTPFNLQDLHPAYNVSITQIAVGTNTTALTVTSIFDTGTSFTYLNDPIYTAISETFHSRAQGRRLEDVDDLPFNYCYDLGQEQVKWISPDLILTMKGGNKFRVIQPSVVLTYQGERIHCLAIAKSEDINIIGQNFMTGYRIVFNRNTMVLGWKESNCSDITNTIDKSRNSPASAPAPAMTFEPQMWLPNNSQIASLAITHCYYHGLVAFLILPFLGSHLLPSS